MPGHTKENCQWFVNHILATHFAKDNASLVAKILRENKSFVRIKRHTGDRPSGGPRGEPHSKPLATQLMAEPGSPAVAITNSRVSRVATDIASSLHDACDEIVHYMSTMACRVAVTDSDTKGPADDDILLDPRWNATNLSATPARFMMSISSLALRPIGMKNYGPCWMPLMMSVCTAMVSVSGMSFWETNSQQTWCCPHCRPSTSATHKTSATQ
jgi:hypothetical protein